MKKQNKIKIFILFIVPLFIVANLGTYQLQRSAWINKNHPYSEAKEYLVGANILWLYGKIITSIPFVDENSLIMKPIINLQDYFIRNWQKNIPKNDAERYLGWYLFRLDSYVVPKIPSLILYDEPYTFDEARNMLDKTWYILDNITKYKAKDKEFEQMRYIAFQKLSYIYIKSVMAYWLNDDKTINYTLLNNDHKRMKRFIRLYDELYKMQNHFKQTDPKIYQNGKHKWFDNIRLHKLTAWIFYYFTIIKQYEIQKDYCNPSKNSMLKDYLITRNNLLDLKNVATKMQDNSIESALSDSADTNLNQTCKKLNLKKGIKNDTNQ